MKSISAMIALIATLAYATQQTRAKCEVCHQDVDRIQQRWIPFVFNLPGDVHLGCVHELRWNSRVAFGSQFDLTEGFPRESSCCVPSVERASIVNRSLGHPNRELDATRSY